MLYMEARKSIAGWKIIYPWYRFFIGDRLASTRTVFLALPEIDGPRGYRWLNEAISSSVRTVTNPAI